MLGRRPISERSSICLPQRYALLGSTDLKDGEMKQVTVGETEVLLARIQGTYHAFYAYCTHYGAPLAEGVISDDQPRLPLASRLF